MMQKMSFFPGLDLNVDASSRTVTAVLAAESLDASMPLNELLAQLDPDQNPNDAHNQMNLFD